jgi:two-component system NtrC family sensor kinase
VSRETSDWTEKESTRVPEASGSRGVRIPISTNLILSFLLTITIISVIFFIVGIRLIGDRVVAEAQGKVRQDLNSAREIYLGELRHISDVVDLTADRFFLKDAMMSGDLQRMTDQLAQVKESEHLDILSITDPYGVVMLRSNNPAAHGDDLSNDNIIEVVLIREVPTASTQITPAQELMLESAALAEQAQIAFVETPLAREREEDTLTDGMMLRAAAPIFDYDGKLIGVLYGGVLLNKNFEIVDTIKQTVFEDLTYNGKDVGTATIFQDDVHISTNVRNEDGSRALGTRVSEDVYNQVVREGEPWIGRAYVVNDWYITAYEPIRNIYNRIIGILYVGVLEQKYLDAKQQTVLAFLAVTFLGTLAAMTLSYLLSKRISVPIERLAGASQSIARGELDTRVAASSNDELGDLAHSFNSMASALQERDKQLKEFTKNKIMESERLALVGQLSANIAHELNNPLQGIVTYSHLLLERLPCEDESSTSSLNRIVTQANRCRDIIRGLLDFSRQRKPDKTICNLNSVLQECLTLVENQALFHNIEIECEFDTSSPMIVIDPAQFQQVALNLIINAAEAMEDGGTLSVSTRFEPENDSLAVMISDTGYGIPEENFEKLFDPFFTTKDVGHGTGLGLAISYGIIKEHGGRIDVESEVGQGTTFTVHLPLDGEEKA